MGTYQLTSSDIILRTADQVWIPNDPTNADRIEYDAWYADGNRPDPYVEPPPPPPSPEDQVLFDHENRIRAIEGQPPLDLAAFAKLKGA